MASLPTCVSGALRLGVALCLPLATAPSSGADSATVATSDATQQLFASIEARWAAALVAADRMALDRYEAPSYVLVNPAGMTLTRAQVDGELFNGHQHFESLAISAVHAWRSGNLAVVTGHASSKESYLGHDTSGEYEFTDIFQRTGGRWLAMHAQLTRVAMPGG